MNFRAFIYYCAVCGAWFAFLGWIPGRLSEKLTAGVLPRAGIKGFCLGLLLALGLSTVDAVWNLALRQFFQIVMRIAVAAIIGMFGGMLGGLIGQFLRDWTVDPNLKNVFVVFGWTLAGLLIGASLGVYELLNALLYHTEMSGPIRKIMKGIVGGTMGGVLGGTLLVIVGGAYADLPWLSSKPADFLWFPSATGFAVLGACIGLLIGVTQVLLKEAWVKIEKGRRAGREMMISKNETTIGRAESCDIGLFGDNGIERLHSRITQQKQGYLITDTGTPMGTIVNGRRIAEPIFLRDGDLIQVGNSVLRFGERTKRP